MEDTLQADWATEYLERMEEADQYSYYMKSLALDQERLLTDIKVLQRLLEEKRIQLIKIESQL